ncbi:hypothetical protein O181_027751 [Austropuccinia psidii MF-1]|uniref:Uncharacterized protein n=1 Tax=Austropuccinia psidii MF-1 TaxID=1389203 RepID=A0A9Q3H1R2_9BASI|nr:hypothetical protein [Austropuccinia psidii MF-1]
MIVHKIQLIAREKSPDALILPHIPSDLKMIDKHSKLQLKLDQYICCPKCYALYYIEAAPNYCDSKLTINSGPCGTELFHRSKFKPLPIINFKTKHNQILYAPRKHGQICLSGKPCLCVPDANFVSQGPSTWLEWFINIPGIENKIEQWAISLSSKGSTIIFDVMQAKGCKNIICDNEPQTSLHLGFCLFVDWFNPRGNRILGKQLPMGVIALNCLKLPPRLRF